MLNRNTSLLVSLLLLCIFSRVFSSIYYIEDIDSLRFALSIKEFDILKLQPHFPGYPVFCFLIKIIHLVIGNMGISFSVVGGASTFFIIYYGPRQERQCCSQTSQQNTKTGSRL